jgi:colanic acid biosynthesis glycosyl transferase WcaI
LRILIHGINYPPEQIGVGKYTGEMAVWLAKSGHEVRVITAPPYYPAWRVSHKYSAWLYRHEELDNVTIWRCPLWVPAIPTAFSRLLHLSSFTISSLPIMLFQALWKPDVVIAIEPPLFCAPQSWLTAHLAGGRSWLHIQDFEIQAFFGLGFGSSSVLKQMLIRHEAWLMSRFDHCSTISNAMLRRLTNINGSASSLSLFPNWVNTTTIRPMAEGRDLRSDWGFASNQKIILYSGNMGKKQGLEIVLDAAEMLQGSHSHAVFLLVGDGAAKGELMQEAGRRLLNNVIFKPLQPFEDLPALLCLADVHIVIQKRGAADAVMPSKIAGILAVGGHVLITADPQTELGQLVADNPGIAVLIEPENSCALAGGIEKMMKTQVRFNPVARAYAEQHLSLDVILKNFEQELSDLVEQKNRR